MDLKQLRKGGTGCHWERSKLQELTIVPRRTLFISGTPTALKVTLYPDTVTHYGMEELWFTRIDKKNLVCESVKQQYDCQGTSERWTCTACAGVHARGGGHEKRKNTAKEKNRTEGRDADICKCSDTDLKRLVPLVGSWTQAWSSHVALRAWGNLKPTDSTCTFLLLMFTVWSSEITGICVFLMLYVTMYFKSATVEFQGREEFASLLGDKLTKPSLWLSWRVPTLVSFFFLFSFLQHLIVLYKSWKTLITKL